MEKNNCYTVVKTADERMTTYRVIVCDYPDDRAICQALTEAASDVWRYVVADAGTYNASQLCNGKNVIKIDDKIPTQLREIRVECSTFSMNIGLTDYYGNLSSTFLFSALSEFERLARVKTADRHAFVSGRYMGGLLCEASVLVPKDIKAICECCVKKDSLRPVLEYPAIDLDRQCVVATDGVVMVAKKVRVASLSCKGKVPDAFCLPKEVAKMCGEITVRLYEHGCSVVDQKGTEASIEDVGRYPRWYTVWPKMRGGMTIIDAKSMVRMTKTVVGTMTNRGKSSNEVVLFDHEGGSDSITIKGLEGVEEKSLLRMENCISDDEVPYRLAADAERLQKALAMNPVTMWAGYRDDNLPNQIVIENLQAEVEIVMMMKNTDDLEDYLSNERYAVSDRRHLYHCFEDDGWFLERIESSKPAAGSPLRVERILTKNIVIMKKYVVDVDITMSRRIYVNADSEEQAKAIVGNYIDDDPWAYVSDGHYVEHEFEAVNECSSEDENISEAINEPEQ